MKIYSVVSKTGDYDMFGIKQTYYSSLHLAYEVYIETLNENARQTELEVNVVYLKSIELDSNVEEIIGHVDIAEQNATEDYANFYRYLHPSYPDRNDY